MRRPLEVLAVGVVLGELLCLAGIRGIWFLLLCLCLGLLVFWGHLERRRIFMVLALGALFGVLRLHAAMVPGSAEKQLQRAEGCCATFRGRIEEIVPRGELTRVRCGAVYLSLREAKGEELQLGKMLTASGTLSPIAAPTNPGEFDYRAYCRARGVTHRMQVRQYAVEGRATPLIEGLRRFRLAAVQRLRAICPEQEAGYLAALLLGDKRELSEDFYARYRRNGIAHLLAISGLHTGFLGLALYRLLRKKCGLRLSGAVTALFLCLYAALTGADTGVLRSSLMLGLGFLALVLGRTYDLRSAAAFALLLLLLFSPLQLFQCGFQLSFLAVFSIGGPGRALTERFAAKRKLLAALIQSLTVFLITLPVISYWFFSLPPYSILLNLLVIPMTGGMLLVGLMLLAAAFLFPPLAAPLIWLLHLSLSIQTLFCRLAECLPFHRILLGRPKFWQLLVYCLCLALGLLLLLDKVPQSRQKKQLRRGLLAFAACVALCSLLPVRSAVPRIWLLDIGQGDAIVIEQGSHCITIDGGSTSRPDCGKQIIEPFLESHALGTVDAAFLTHADQDHTNGMTYLAGEESDIRVKRFLLNPAAETDAHYTKLKAALQANPDIELCYMGAGDVYGSFDCLWPPREALPEEVNEQSLVLLFTANGKRCLFTGDAGLPSEEKLLERLRKSGQAAALTKIYLLKVGHHGSKGASSEDFLSQLSPDCALISCGRGNSYGHPHAEAVERLKRYAGELHSTAEEGALSVELRP